MILKTILKLFKRKIKAIEGRVNAFKMSNFYRPTINVGKSLAVEKAQISNVFAIRGKSLNFNISGTNKLRRKNFSLFYLNFNLVFR